MSPWPRPSHANRGGYRPAIAQISSISAVKPTNFRAGHIAVARRVGGARFFRSKSCRSMPGPSPVPGWRQPGLPVGRAVYPRARGCSGAGPFRPHRVAAIGRSGPLSSLFPRTWGTSLVAARIFAECLGGDRGMLLQCGKGAGHDDLSGRANQRDKSAFMPVRCKQRNANKYQQDTSRDVLAEKQY